MFMDIRSGAFAIVCAPSPKKGTEVRRISRHPSAAGDSLSLSLSFCDLDRAIRARQMLRRFSPRVKYSCDFEEVRTRRRRSSSGCG